jgi:uncharacterized membrane protein YhaH (DUF805 family)
MLILFSQALLITLIKASGGDIKVVSGTISSLSLVPQLAIGIKRCHDRNRSGWFVLIAFIPLVQLWYFVEMGFLSGTRGDNRFGPDLVKSNQ